MTNIALHQCTSCKTSLAFDHYEKIAVSYQPSDFSLYISGTGG